MSRTLFLDIDGVLMAHTQQPPSRKLGFTDWHKVGKRGERPFGFGGWISDEQQAFILDVFGNADDRIVWLTTWELSAFTPGGANGSFSDHIGWAHHDVFPDDWLEASYNFALGSTWWKRDILHRAHVMAHEYVAADHIVWVDDELAHNKLINSRSMLDMHRKPGTFSIVGPDPAWSRESIESFRL